MIEKSWAEQREYITKALSTLSAEHKKEAEEKKKEEEPALLAEKSEEGKE